MTRSRVAWLALAVLCLSFWAIVVLVQGEWAEIHAWGGLAGGAYILYWQCYPDAVDGHGSVER